MTRRIRDLVLCSTLGSLLLLSTRGAAQDAQYWDIQYGPVGQLLGGQVVGSTRDLSATYYNPGGLALGEAPDFLLSVQAFRRQTLATKPVGGGQFLSLTDTEWGTFPGFVSFAFPESWLGEKTRLAFSLLTRQQDIQRIDQRFTGIEPVSRGPYGLETLFDQRMNEVWGGLTVSRRLGDRWGLGTTVYGVYRGQRTRYEQNLQLDPAAGQGVSALVVNDYDYNHWRILGKIGLAREGQTFRFGAAVTTPGAGLFGSGNVGYTRSATGVDMTGDGLPDTLLANGLDEDLGSTYESSWAFAGGGAWRRGSVQVHVSAEYFAPVHDFTVLQGESLTPLGQPVTLTQTFDAVLNAGAAIEYWLGGEKVDSGAKHGGTVVYGAIATDQSASPDVVVSEASTSNQDHYHVSGGTAFSVGRNRFSLGASYTFGHKQRDISLAALPPQVPVIGGSHLSDVTFTRWVFVVGYLFGR
jgi:hypothetical protein